MHDWKKVILKANHTLADGIQILEKEALGIIMIANDQMQLLGTVTDGDIRRALLNHLGMTASLESFMHKEPVTASVDDDRGTVLNMMKQKLLLQVPVIDADQCIVGLETIHHLIKAEKRENPVFLMAGGFGKRLRPLTDKVPKPLLNIGNKPILQTILEQFIESGFHNFYIATHYKAEMLKEYFGNGDRWGVKIIYIDEKAPLGTAGALGLLPDLPDLPIVLMNGDLLTKVDFLKLLNFHEQKIGLATMCVREYDYKIPYGVVQFSEEGVSAIVEKPVHSFFINAGIYVLEPSLINSIGKNEYIDMPDLLEKNIKDHKRVNMYPIHEYWLDIGQMKDFEQAQVDISK